MTDLTKLAEKAAKFLGLTEDESHIWWPNDLPVRRFDSEEADYMFFEGERSAPILAHLAKREMEKRGFSWEVRFKPESLSVTRSHYRVEMRCHDSEGYGIGKHENEYIALWLAIEATGVLDE